MRLKPGWSRILSYLQIVIPTLTQVNLWLLGNNAKLYPDTIGIKHMRIGVDLGGTKIEVIIIDYEGWELIRLRAEAPQNDYKNTLQAIKYIVKEAEENIATLIKGAGKIPVGVGIPGAICPESGLVKNANSTWLIGHPIDEDLKNLLERPVKIANDANCFALSEATDGAAVSAETVFGVILGTGVGGSLIVRGAALGGPNLIAGEWGHNPLPWSNQSGPSAENPGPKCYCGLYGCTETFLSGSGLQRAYIECGGIDTTMPPSPAEIASLARRGNSAAIETLNLYCNRLARALASVINIVDPDIIVLGGGLSNISDLYSGVPELWGQWVFSNQVNTVLLQNKHGDSSGVRGAASLWPANYSE